MHEKICEDSSSFDLMSADIATAIEELQRLANKLLEEAQAESESLVEMTESSMPVQEFDIDDLLKLKGGSSGFTSKGAGLSKLNDVIKVEH
ncbi:hypothetical protein KUTeg_016248 [Tegillarca granosa]|uniref:Uncharacterized protein n=1 Tax=Tegillarca granosa TaxID=220873 RepID=A0ABQ9EKB2_TEGGR|nr:hypothetical protein KUTeg_016248 [Tegillarca granosa]